MKAVPIHVVRPRFMITLLGFVLIACNVQDTDDLPNTTPATPSMMHPPAADETVKYFDSTRIMQIQINIDPTDWDMLRKQSRDFVDLLSGSDCMDQPFAKIFTYFSGEILIDGTKITNVGIRKKGFLGSLSNTRPSLKIKFNEYLPEQTFSGFERMTLNNVQQDPSVIGQCLAFSIYAKAGVPAPRCSFAHVTVNDQDLGIYAHLDSIKKRFLSRHFENNDGTLWEGTVSDFRENWNKTFEQKTDREMVASRAKLEALTTALALPNDQLFEAIAPHIDLERFLNYWAVESLVWHWDGYAGNRNNYYVYENPENGKFDFIAWGVDSAFTENHPFRDRGGRDGNTPGPLSVLAQGHLANRIYNHPEGRSKYLAKLQSLLNQVWDENALLSQISDMETLVRNSIIRDGFDKGVDNIRDFVRNRRATLQTDIDKGGVDWAPEAPKTICREPRGRIQGEFSTTWGTHPTENNFQTGTGTISLEFEGNVVSNMPAGASAGMADNENADKALLLTVGCIPVTRPRPGKYCEGLALLYILVPPERLETGEILEIDRKDVSGGLLYRTWEQREFMFVGQLSSGTITLEKAGISTNNEIVARYDLEVF